MLQKDHVAFKQSPIFWISPALPPSAGKEKVLGCSVLCTESRSKKCWTLKKSTQSIKIPKVKKDNVCLSFLLHFSILHGVYILILRERRRTFTFSKSFEKLYYHTRSSSLTKILKIIGYFSPSRTLKCLNSCLSS